uniref:Putative ovule protein n=1 Tax=Solanum chacoense TaxID=4108 RepID=A0A0V0HE05_SOLCH
MSCISTSSIFILVNGRPTNYFLLTRGIRQGDPLSPYIFLSRLISYATQERLWQPLKIDKIGPTILQILFTDDIILMAKADITNASTIIHIFNILSLQSGKKINFKIYFILFLKCKRQGKR